MRRMFGFVGDVVLIKQIYITFTYKDFILEQILQFWG